MQADKELFESLCSLYGELGKDEDDPDLIEIKKHLKMAIIRVIDKIV